VIKLFRPHLARKL